MAVLLAPKLFVLACVHEFGTDRKIVAMLHDPPHDQCLHAKLPRHLLGFDLTLLVTEGRGARDHLQIWETRQPVNDALRYSVAQVFRVRITAGIREGQYSNRVDAGATTAAWIECCHGNDRNG